MAEVVLNSIQTGQKLVDSSSISDSVTIEPVDTSKSILLYSYRLADSSQAGGTRLIGTLSNSTTITFEKDGTGSDIIVEWKVVEFDSGVFVQHVYSTSSNGTIDTTISTVNMNKTFVLSDGFWKDSTSTRSTEKPRSFLTSETNVRMLRASGISGIRSVCQVVQIDNADVQTGFLNTTRLGDTAAISSVSPEKAFVVCSASDSSAVKVQGADDWALSARLTDSTTISFTRYSNDRELSVRWYVVEIPDAGFQVQRGEHMFSGVNAEDIALSGIAPDASVPVMGGQGQYHARTTKASGGGSAYPGSAASSKIASSTTLEVECDGWVEDDAIILDWQVLSFSSSGGSRIHDFMPFFAGMITGV